MDFNKKDAKTRSGKYAKFIRYDDFSWPCPWIFSIEGESKNFHYSVGGFINRSHIVKKFDCSPQLAGNDLTKFQQDNPNWVQYDNRRKAYVNIEYKSAL